jgi:hypothetical protein
MSIWYKSAQLNILWLEMAMVQGLRGEEWQRKPAFCGHIFSLKQNRTNNGFWDWATSETGPD